MSFIEHKCEDSKKCMKIHYVHGTAYDSIFYDPSTEHWFVGNGEYYTKINYCPCCGIKLEVPKSDAKENGVHPIGKT